MKNTRVESLSPEKLYDLKKSIIQVWGYLHRTVDDLRLFGGDKIIGEYAVEFKMVTGTWPSLEILEEKFGPCVTHSNIEWVLGHVKQRFQSREIRLGRMSSLWKQFNEKR